MKQSMHTELCLKRIWRKEKAGIISRIIYFFTFGIKGRTEWVSLEERVVRVYFPALDGRTSRGSRRPFLDLWEEDPWGCDLSHVNCRCFMAANISEDL